LLNFAVKSTLETTHQKKINRIMDKIMKTRVFWLACKPVSTGSGQGSKTIIEEYEQAIEYGLNSYR
jgi:hypothetical protein